ncbi:MAG: hypothetical protein KKB12_00020, partial [Candidatus Omnitrophica bacterium]|nr:hypothetical protein [Candidatus Omnitrophota bacterium]
MRRRTTILSVGEKKDFDSYEKFHKQRHVIRSSGFVYRSIDFDRLFTEGVPVIKNERVIVFIFFPFKYWDNQIEHKTYRGMYGNLTFHKKFMKYGKAIRKRLEETVSADEIIFVNNPETSALYRDKFIMKKVLSKNGVNIPRDVSSRSIGGMKRILERDGRIFIKPRCGSMGKGITYLEKGNWQTNLELRRNKITSKHSDYGWVFKDITENRSFLRELLKKDIIAEEAIDPLKMNSCIVDFRVYVFLNKVLYIYPRKGKSGAITTNISQGAKGSPRIRAGLSSVAIKKIEEQCILAMKALNLNFAGIDVMLDKYKKKAYVIDVNMFPGFPKTTTFNIPY